MQPEPLSPPQEEVPPESEAQPIESLTPTREEISPESSSVEPEIPPVEPLSMGAGTQTEAGPVQEVAKPEPTPIPEKRSSKWRITAIALGIFAFILLVGVAGLGFWAYTLNAKLTVTQQELAAVQAEHGKLQTDYEVLTGSNEKLNTDLTQAKTDLEKANADLANAQADLKKAQDQNKKLSTQINKAGKLADILYAWFTTKNASDVFKIDSQIKATSDTKLKSLWSEFTASPSDDKFGEFLVYLIGAIRSGLK